MQLDIESVESYKDFKYWLALSDNLKNHLKYVWEPKYRNNKLRGTWSKSDRACSEEEFNSIFAKNYILKLIKIEFKNFIRSNSFHDEREFTSKFKAGAVKKSAYFEFSNFSEQLNYYRMAVKKIDENKSVLLNSVEQASVNKKAELVEAEEHLNKIENNISEEQKIQERLKKAKAMIALKSSELSDLRNNNTIHQSGMKKGTGLIKTGSIICASKNAFDLQVSMLANEQFKLVRNCEVLQYKKNVMLEDISMLSGECTYIDVNDGQKIWAFCESYISYQK